MFGFVKVAEVLTTEEITALLGTLGDVDGAGRRGMLAVPAVAQLARCAKVLDLVRPHLAREARPVRAIYFDKSLDANWGVSWHQDITLAVRERAEVGGFCPWSEKDGVPHVQCPAHFLEQMLTVRLHLDDCDESNGALRLLIGSHRFGRVEGTAQARCIKECAEMVCRMTAGDALIMRPLILHASGHSRSNGHRRVLHIEYAGFELPRPLEWAEGEVVQSKSQMHPDEHR